MTSQPDTTILWCLEQLATENIDTDILTCLIKHVTETRGAEAVEDPLKVRLMLAEISRSAEITGNTLEDLQQIAAMINQTQDSDLIENRRALLPPPELMTQVKTELVAQGWRNSVSVTARQLTTLIRKNFGQQPEAREQEIYDKLVKAVTMPGYRAEVDRRLDGNSVLNGILRYVNQAQNALGPTLLQIVNEDINSGNYIPGQPLPEQAPQPGAALIASPTRLPPAPASRRASHASDIPLLNQAMAELQRCGGADPLQQASAQAQILLAAAALTGAVTNAQHQPAARAPPLSPGGPAFPNRTERPAPEPLRRVSYGNGDNAAPMRRRNKRWTEAEVQRLIEGCRKHGPGAWSLIQMENADLWGDERTQVDLKDKWRNMTSHKDDRAFRNNPEAVEIDNLWKEKRVNYRGAGETSTLEEIEEEEEEVVNAAAAAAAAAADAAMEAIDEENEEEEAPETTEELENVESEGEAEGDDEEEEQQQEEEPPAPAAKKQKRTVLKKIAPRKNQRKPAKKSEPRTTRSKRTK